MNNRKFTKHKITVLQGALGDMAVDQLGWLSQEEQDKFWKEHNENVEKLKASGQYLQPIEYNVELEFDPLYDSKLPKSKGMESYRFTFLDFTQK